MNCVSLNLSFSHLRYIFPIFLFIYPSRNYSADNRAIYNEIENPLIWSITYDYLPINIYSIRYIILENISNICCLITFNFDNLVL